MADFWPNLIRDFCDFSDLSTGCPETHGMGYGQMRVRKRTAVCTHTNTFFESVTKFSEGKLVLPQEILVEVIFYFSKSVLEPSEGKTPGQR